MTFDILLPKPYSKKKREFHVSFFVTLCYHASLIVRKGCLRILSRRNRKFQLTIITIGTSYQLIVIIYFTLMIIHDSVYLCIWNCKVNNFS